VLPEFDDLPLHGDPPFGRARRLRHVSLPLAYLRRPRGGAQTSSGGGGRCLVPAAGPPPGSRVPAPFEQEMCQAMSRGGSWRPSAGELRTWPQPGASPGCVRPGRVAKDARLPGIRGGEPEAGGRVLAGPAEAATAGRASCAGGTRRPPRCGNPRGGLRESAGASL
jgi:hypothetical protein